MYVLHHKLSKNIGVKKQTCSSNLEIMYRKFNGYFILYSEHFELITYSNSYIFNLSGLVYGVRLGVGEESGGGVCLGVGVAKGVGLGRSISNTKPSLKLKKVKFINILC